MLIPTLSSAPTATSRLGCKNSAPYRPIFIVSARLTRASDKTVLTQDAVVYNPLNPNDRVVTIAPDPA